MSSIISFFQSFLNTLWTWILPSAFKLALIIFIAFIAKYLIDLTTDKFVHRSISRKRAETLKQITHSTSKVIIIAIAIMMVLNELGLDIRPIIASAGILGVAFSLGAQNLMKDVINGFFILFEDQFGVGDSVRIGDHSGIVEKMNLRTTTLKDQNGNVHIIPNGEIKQVTVVSRG